MDEWEKITFQPFSKKGDALGKNGTRAEKIEILPYTGTHEIRIAVQELTQGPNDPKIRREITARMVASGDLSLPALPVLIGNLQKHDIELQLCVLKMLMAFQKNGYCLSIVAGELGPFLAAGNSDIRNLALDVLDALGHGAKLAEEYAIGCLRNADSDIRQAGAKVLRAIGRSCSKSIISRLQQAMTRQGEDAVTVSYLKDAINELASARSGHFASPTQVLDAVGPTTDSTAKHSPAILIAMTADRFREALAAVLKRAGMTVLLADTGTTAAKSLRASITSPPGVDLLVLDLVLPEINGLTLISLIRESNKLASLPALVISSIDKKEVVAKALKLGIQGYLAKPVEMKNVLTEIFKLVKH